MPPLLGLRTIQLAGEVAIKGVEHVAPVGLAVGDLVELPLELRREAEVEQVVEVLHQSSVTSSPIFSA